MAVEIRGSAMSGFVSGKRVQVQFRPVGNAPPPGNYTLLPAVQDPIYGQVVLMAPQSGGWQNAAIKPWMPGFSLGGLVSAGSVAEKVGWLAGAIKDGGRGSNLGGLVFVLSDRPIAGMNSLVVTFGFADLISALRLSGGATISVR